MHKNYKKDIVEQIYNTNVKSVFKNDYASSRAVYSDDAFVYKVFKHSKIVDQFEMFLKNYRGDLKLLDVFKDTECAIFKFNKLPGKTMNELVDEDIALDLDTLTEWFKDQVKHIHLAGVQCYERYNEFKIKQDPWEQGFVYAFFDWNRSNYIYDETTNKLYLVDLEPSNWVPRNVWDCIIRDHFTKFIKSFDHIILNDKNYISQLEDNVQQQLNKEIPLFLACPAGVEPATFSSAN